MKKFIGIFLVFIILMFAFSQTASANRTLFWFLSSDKNIGKSAGSLLKKIVNGQGVIVTISNTANGEIPDFPVKINLTSLGFAENLVVVTDSNNNPLDFCYEHTNLSCNTTPSNIIWVKIPNIPANSSIQISIKNSSSNNAKGGRYVFDAYADFEDYHTTAQDWYIYNDNCINMNYFHAGIGSYVCSNSCDIGTWDTSWNNLGYVYRIYYRTGISSTDYIDYVDFVLETQIMSDGTGIYSEPALGFVGWFYVIFGIQLNKILLFDNYTKIYYPNTCSQLLNMNTNTPYKAKLVYSKNKQKVYLYINDELCWTFNTNRNLTYLQPTISSDGDGSRVYFDNIRFYKISDKVSINIE